MRERRAKNPRVVLVVGTDDDAIARGMEAAIAAGKRVLCCHTPGEDAFPCNAFVEGRTCPLDEGFDVAVTVRGVANTTMSVSEFGAICALRAGKPLIVAGAHEPNPFTGVEVGRIDCDPPGPAPAAAADEVPGALDPDFSATDLRFW